MTPVYKIDRTSPTGILQTFNVVDSFERRGTHYTAVIPSDGSPVVSYWTAELFYSPEAAWADFLAEKQREHDAEVKNAKWALDRAEKLKSRIDEITKYLTA